MSDEQNFGKCGKKMILLSRIISTEMIASLNPPTPVRRGEGGCVSAGLLPLQKRTLHPRVCGVQQGEGRLGRTGTLQRERLFEGTIANKV
jgi:hypothetical protein